MSVPKGEGYVFISAWSIGSIVENKLPLSLRRIKANNNSSDNWAQHPGLNLAMDGLSAYANWVSRVVMPIVFQWVDEHRKEVYENVPDGLCDDVGVVVAAAFDIVKQKNAYKEGREAFAEFQKQLAAETWQTENVNPTWTEISKNLRTEVRVALNRASKPLEMAKSA